MKKTLKNRVFKKKDFISNDGFVTSTWGPSQWHFLHTISFNYPTFPTDFEKEHYMNYVLSLEHVLPCKYCRDNLRDNFKKLPLTMEQMKNRETFSKYIYNLHELVNKRLKKKSKLTYADVRERYEHLRSRCLVSQPKKICKKTKKKKELGCTEPLYGNKSMSIIKIVPFNNKTTTFQIEKKCLKHYSTSNT
jgi:hypothetical protein